MTPPFAFGFSGDDIDVDAGDAEDEMQIDGIGEEKLEQPAEQAELLPPQRHSLVEMVRR